MERTQHERLLKLPNTLCIFLISSFDGSWMVVNFPNRGTKSLYWWSIMNLFVQVLLELARSRNKIPLPKLITPPGGIPLPPEQDTLISPNYQLLIPRKQSSQVEENEEDEDGSNPKPNPAMSQEQKTSTDQQSQQQTPQRVSFPLNSAAAAAKRPRWEGGWVGGCGQKLCDV